MVERTQVLSLPPDGRFDPLWLVDALRRNCCDDAVLIDAATRCTRFIEGDELYVRFVSSDRANQSGAEWQFARNVVIEDTAFGEIVLDVLKDGRIGGIGFLDAVFAASREAAR